jgi:hypothetical protein
MNEIDFKHLTLIHHFIANLILAPIKSLQLIPNLIFFLNILLIYLFLHKQFAPNVDNDLVILNKKGVTRSISYV